MTTSLSYLGKMYVFLVHLPVKPWPQLRPVRGEGLLGGLQSGLPGVALPLPRRPVGCQPPGRGRRLLAIRGRRGGGRG